ncbi:hypothetical protein BKA62DRAFT_487214 [Auriculariales sp. MPI-PUGE-AT-0066]|nr:hypothetical protein BKA62DRAFT_487214 [Auriculariales sp. MPI-PUGE-AT-0066]
MPDLPTELICAILINSVRQYMGQDRSTAVSIASTSHAVYNLVRADLYYTIFINDRNYRTVMLLIRSRSRILNDVRRLYAPPSFRLDVSLYEFPWLQEFDARPITVTPLLRPPITRLYFRAALGDVKVPRHFQAATHFTTHLPRNCFFYGDWLPSDDLGVRKHIEDLAWTLPHLTHFGIDLRDFDLLEFRRLDCGTPDAMLSESKLPSALQSALDGALRLGFRGDRQSDTGLRSLECVAVYVSHANLVEWRSTIEPMMRRIVSNKPDDAARLHIWVDSREATTVEEEERMHALDAVRRIDIFSEAQPILSLRE